MASINRIELKIGDNISSTLDTAGDKDEMRVGGGLKVVYPINSQGIFLLASWL